MPTFFAGQQNSDKMILGHGANTMTMDEARAKLCAQAKYVFHFLVTMTTIKLKIPLELLLALKKIGCFLNQICQRLEYFSVVTVRGNLGLRTSA